MRLKIIENNAQKPDGQPAFSAADARPDPCSFPTMRSVLRVYPNTNFRVPDLSAGQAHKFRVGQRHAYYFHLYNNNITREYCQVSNPRRSPVPQAFAALRRSSFSSQSDRSPSVFLCRDTPFFSPLFVFDRTFLRFGAKNRGFSPP